MSIFKIEVPSLGESITEAVIAKWFKKEGEVVEKDEVIVELETDKVTQEIYSPKKGTIKKILLNKITCCLKCYAHIYVMYFMR